MKNFLKMAWRILGTAIISILVLIPFGCTLKDQNINGKEDIETKVTQTNDTQINEDILYIDADLDFYSPTMSMVPGLPLKGRFESDNITQNMRYHWITVYGSFLSWDDDGVIGELGSDFFNYGEKIFWSPEFFKQDNTIKEFEILLKLEDSTGKNVLAEAVLIIEVIEEGFFTKSP